MKKASQNRAENAAARQQAEILIEASKPEALKGFLLDVLAAGVSVIPLSTGVFADEAFLEEFVVDRTAPELVLENIPSEGDVFTGPAFCPAGKRRLGERTDPGLVCGIYRS